MSRSVSASDRNVVAVLGPTNTGKTHTAVERMLGHATGMIGLPLRLLAREVYDRVVAIKGPTRVALITGEEKIIPDNPAYFVCTVESMPLEKDVGFLAVDEVQLAADDQRGHIFTDRLLRARGQHETMLMGADTIRPLIKKLLPGADIMSRPRFSELRYVKPKKLSRLPRRTAIVAFSAADVYGVAELLRRQKGGSAIVMGALSPRTRNAQVELYQSGEVDYLVATDAIGMGLNMDIDHVAFAGLRKFDGRLLRALTPAELAQIAGRAGRHMNQGTFSTLSGGSGGEANGLDPQTVSQIEDHAFPPIKHLMWRNPALDFTTVRDLMRSLDVRPERPGLSRAPMAIDQTVLKTLSGDAEILGRASGREAVRLLWEACQIPDFRKISPDEHARLLARIFHFRTEGEGFIPHDWFARQVSHLDNVDGDIETLAGRIAGVRIWTYVSHRHGWLAERQHWAHVTRALEDKLSDALHQRLMQRFVDRRTAVLMRELKQKGDVFVTLGDDNTVSVEGHVLGELRGFSFFAERTDDADTRKLMNNAAERALQTHLKSRVTAFLKAEDGAVALQPGQAASDTLITWDGAPIARLRKGASPLRPGIDLVRDSMLRGALAERVTGHLGQWLTGLIDETLSPLAAIEMELAAEPIAGKPAAEQPAPVAGLARGVTFRLLERFGVLPRNEVDEDLRQIDQDARKGLRRLGIRIGAGTIFIPALLKPRPTSLRIMLWALYEEIDELPDLPTPGMVWVEMDEQAPVAFYTLAGFRQAGTKAVRADMLERLADEVRPMGEKGALFETTPEIMGLVGLSGDDFIAVMKTIGYARVPAPKVATEARADAESAKAAQSNENTSEKQTTEPLFFRWRPRKPTRRERSGQKANDTNVRSKQTAGEPGRKTAPRGTPKKRKPLRAQEQKPDPHSPFAALQGLRDAMASETGRRKKPGPTAKTGPKHE